MRVVYISLFCKGSQRSKDKAWSNKQGTLDRLVYYNRLGYFAGNTFL